MVQAISEYDTFSCSSYKPYESLMSRKNLLMYSSLENSGACCSLAETSTKRSSVSASLSKSLSSVQSISGHKHPPMTGHTEQNPSAPNVFQISSAAVSLLFRWPLSVPSGPPFPFNSFPLGSSENRPPRLSFSRPRPASVLHFFSFFFKVVINKNPCERWLYSRDWAEGMEFITLFDWVTPRLGSRSKQLLDFHPPPWPPASPFSLLSSPQNSTSRTPPWPCFLPPRTPSLSDTHPYLCFLFFFAVCFYNFVTLLTSPFSPCGSFLLDTCCTHKWRRFLGSFFFFKSRVACFELNLWWKLL